MNALWFDGVTDADGNVYWFEDHYDHGGHTARLVTASPTGTIRWTATWPGAAPQHGLAVHGSTLFILAPENLVEARDTRSGAQLWSVDLLPWFAQDFPSTDSYCAALPKRMLPGTLSVTRQGTVFVSTGAAQYCYLGRGWIVAIDAASGALLYSNRRGIQAVHALGLAPRTAGWIGPFGDSGRTRQAP